MDQQTPNFFSQWLESQKKMFDSFGKSGWGQSPFNNPTNAFTGNPFFQQQSAQNPFSSLQDFYRQQQQVFEQMNAFSHLFEQQEQLKKYWEAFVPTVNWMEKARNVAGMDMEHFMNLGMKVNETFENNFAPYTYLHNATREMEFMGKVQAVQQAFMMYVSKASQFQAKLMESTKNSFPDTIKAVYADFQQKKGLPDWEGFYARLIETTEEHLSELLKTEEFAQAQSELAHAGLEMKNKMDEIKEVIFSGLPFLTKSEAEDIVYELQSVRRKVRQIEKKGKAQEKTIRELQAEMEALKKAFSEDKKAAASN